MCQSAKNRKRTGFDAFAAETTATFHQVLGIPPENIYIKFDDIQMWSVSGMFIDRRKYR